MSLIHTTPTAFTEDGIPIIGAYGPKPVLRGRIHQYAFFASIPAGIWLLAVSKSTTALVAAAVYWASLAGLFAASASYHLLAHSESAVKWLRRLDHSMIFVLIGGSYTPFCLLAMPPRWGIPMLIGIWLTVAVGVGMKMVRVSSSGGKSGSWLYMVLGWSAVLTVPVLLDALGGGRMILLAVTGVLFTGGAVVLGTRRPNPIPRVFGYHEVWHAATVLACGCHFVLVASLVH